MARFHTFGGVKGETEEILFRLGVQVRFESDKRNGLVLVMSYLPLLTTVIAGKCYVSVDDLDAPQVYR